MASFSELPEDVWEHLSLFLPAPCVLNLLSTQKQIHDCCAKQGNLWKALVREQYGENLGTTKEDYLRLAYSSRLPVVRWRPFEFDSLISSREGHVACTLGDGIVVLSGGFSDDDNVYVWDANEKFNTWQESELCLVSRQDVPRSVYGASLTSLNDGKRAVQFGGFMGGGYSNQINQVALLQVVKGKESFEATWQIKMRDTSRGISGRAYHTATLVADRYLLIVGGMREDQSILQEAILDTQEWKWITAFPGIATSDGAKPEARHGHSMVLDAPRNRLVMFGGGNGSDLLRSGRDFNDVWELDMGQDGKWKTDLVRSLPWTWKPVHKDSATIEGVDDEEDDSDDEDYVEEEEEMEDLVEDEEEIEEGSGEKEEKVEDRPSKAAKVSGDAPAAAALPTPPNSTLTPVQSLCIGRCHNAMHVTRDTVVFAFGSGRPSTNGVLAYDLARDVFHEPIVSGQSPLPRFTGVAVSPKKGSILYHGGYSTQRGTCTSDWVQLDLAPALSADSSQIGMRSFPAVSERDLQRNCRGYRGNAFASGRNTLAMLLAHMTGNDDDEDDNEGLREMRMRMAESIFGGIMVVNHDDGDGNDEDEDDAE